VRSYFDTSALLKLILQESGSTTAERAARAATRLHAVTVLLAEAGAALASAHRNGRLSLRSYQIAKHSLMVVWAPFLPVVPDMQLVRRAAALAEQEALRGYDAVHLAGALEAQVDVFVCSDTNLVRAARNCGLRVIDTRV
jgi:predicted nucleic acid-binding protein